MTNPSGPGGPAESLYDFLLLVYTDAEIAGDEEYHTWWDREFADIQAVPGLGEGIRHFVDPDQRVGQVPSWRYLVLHGFRGDVEQLTERVRSHTTGNGAMWLCEAVGDFAQKLNSRPRTGDPKLPEAPDHVFMALTNAKVGRESEFHEWYNLEHVPDVLAVDCYVSGRRYRVAATDGPPALWEYLALYRFVGSVPEMHAVLLEEMARGEARMTDALEPDDAAWIYSPI